jgi:hypothetical protein
MGLDQYAKTRNPKTGEVEEFMYWRKHNALHGWMENLWRSKGYPNKNEDSKDIPLELTLELTHEDLDALEKDLLGKGTNPALRTVSLDKDLRFIQEARTYLDSGLEVVYDSWW